MRVCVHVYINNPLPPLFAFVYLVPFALSNPKSILIRRINLLLSVDLLQYKNKIKIIIFIVILFLY